MSLNEAGALYDTAKAPDLQDVPIMAKCDPEPMVWQEQALKTQAVCTNLTSVLTRTEHQYRTTWVKASTKGFKGGFAWIKPSKKDMAVTFSYSPLEY